MDGLDYWRFCRELNVLQAALLILGKNPEEWERCVLMEMKGKGEDWEQSTPKGFRAVFSALTQDIIAGRLQATYRHPMPVYQAEERLPIIKEAGELELYPGLIFRTAYDFLRTTVEVEDLRAWLIGHGLTTGFFFPAGTDLPDYLDPSNPRYAPKLAAAVQAWQAVTDSGGKSPKQALTKWLREHAAEFGLTDDEGKPNETAIEEIAKVANWLPGGGAPKTPGE